MSIQLPYELDVDRAVSYHQHSHRTSSFSPSATQLAIQNHTQEVEPAECRAFQLIDVECCIAALKGLVERIYSWLRNQLFIPLVGPVPNQRRECLDIRRRKHASDPDKRLDKVIREYVRVCAGNQTQCRTKISLIVRENR